jgi:long-subunit acyl-CoA synthetase (AMP-forming)
MKGRAEELSSVLANWEKSAGSDRAVEILQRAEELIGTASVPASTWHEYLDLTGSPSFLGALPDREHRERWADTAFRAIWKSDYRLENRLDLWARSRPTKPYLQETTGPSPEVWTYAGIAKRLRLIAGAFIAAADGEPRVAIVSDNSGDSASCDLACLVYGIFVTPLNVHFDSATLARIFDLLSINIVVADSEERIRHLQSMRLRCARPFRIFLTGALRRQSTPDVLSLGAACALEAPVNVARMLASRPKRGLTEPATAMFTSGSTGSPKGLYSRNTTW